MKISYSGFYWIFAALFISFRLLFIGPISFGGMWIPVYSNNFIDSWYLHRKLNSLKPNQTKRTKHLCHLYRFQKKYCYSKWNSKLWKLCDKMRKYEDSNKTRSFLLARLYTMFVDPCGFTQETWMKTKVTEKGENRSEKLSTL